MSLPYKQTLITGRNEVLAKVIFLHLSVIHSVHGGVGVCSNFSGGCSNFLGGVCSNFSGGCALIFLGGCLRGGGLRGVPRGGT